MALQKQPFTLPLAQGMQQKKNPQTLTGGVTLVENGVHRKDEELKKRYGWTSLPLTKSGGGVFDSADAVATFEDELLLWSDNHIYTWSSAQSSWIDRGAAYSAAVSTKQIIASNTSFYFADSAYTSGVVLVCYEIEDGSATMVRYQMYDYLSGAILKGDTAVATSGNALRPKCVALAGVFVIVYSISASTIKAITVNAITGAVGAAVTLASNMITSTQFDAIAPASDTLMLAYADTSGNIAVKYFNSSLGARGAPYTDSTSASSAPTMLRLIPLSLGRVLVAYLSLSTTSQVVAKVISATGSIGSLINTVHGHTTDGFGTENISGHADGSDAIIYVEHAPSFEPHNRFVYKVTVPTDGIGISVDGLLARSLGIATRGFVRDGVGFVGLLHTSDLQSTCFVYDQNGTIVSRHQPSAAGGFPSSTGPRGCISSVWSAVTGKYEFALTNKTRVLPVTDTFQMFTFAGSTAPAGSNLFSPLNVCVTSLDFQDNSNFSSVEIGGSVLIAGGVVCMYDGLSVVEHGFLLYPEGLSSALTGASGLANGTYLYSAIYEWTDAKGYTHRSAPSVPLSVTVTGGPKSVQITVPMLRVTRKISPRSNVTIALYRTLAGQTATFYRVTSITDPEINSPTLNTIVITDSLADASLPGREYLYTTGGILDNTAPMGAKYLKVWRGRVILAGLEDGSVQYSKPWQKGGPVEFAAENTLEVESEGGPAMAIEILDDKCVLFKKETGYITYGEGPDAAGLGGSFPAFTAVSGLDVGCIDQQSTAALPGAIIFKSLKGYYLLGSDLSASFIGAEIEDYNSLAVSSATLFASENEVRITNSDGVALVYNYYFKKWSVFTSHEAVDALRWQGAFLHLKSDGRVCVETENTYRDNGANFDVSIITGWNALSDIAGFQRVWRCQITGTYVSPVSVTLSAAYDNDDTWISAGAVAMSGESYGWQYVLKRQKCTSIRFKIAAAVSELVLSGEGLKFTALSLLFGIKRPLGKVAAAQKTGLTTI